VDLHSVKKPIGSERDSLRRRLRRSLTSGSTNVLLCVEIERGNGNDNENGDENDDGGDDNGVIVVTMATTTALIVVAMVTTTVATVDDDDGDGDDDGDEREGVRGHRVLGAMETFAKGGEKGTLELQGGPNCGEEG
jgi:hypothetical protein